MGIWFGAKLVGWIIPLLLTKAGWDRAAEWEGHLMAIFPWYHAPKLISRDLWTLSAGVGSLLLLAAIGYALTYLTIRRRDV